MRKPLMILGSIVFMYPALGMAQGLNTAAIDQVLGHSGQKTGDVYRMGLPRTDLHVELSGIALKPGFALGSWAAFSGTDADCTVTGDLVLVQSEVGPVMGKIAQGRICTSCHTDKTTALGYRFAKGSALANDEARRAFARHEGKGGGRGHRSLRGISLTG